MEFDELLRRHLDDLHAPEAHFREAVEQAIAGIHAQPDQHVPVDLLLEAGAHIGAHLHCVPDDVASLPDIKAVIDLQHRRRHLHEVGCFALVYVHAGRAIHHHRGGTDELSAGDVLFIGPGVLHDVEPAPGSAVVVIALSSNLLEQSIWTLLPHARTFTGYIGSFRRGAATVAHFLSAPVAHQVDPARVRALVEAIVVEHAERKTGWSAVCEAYLVALFTLLDRSAPGRSPDEADHDARELVRDILAWVSRHYADATLARLAEVFRYSPSHISRLIRRHAGRNLIDIVREIKLERAAEALLTSPLPIHDIARAVGFASASHLHKLFRRRYGMSPTEYRRRSTVRLGTGGASPATGEGSHTGGQETAPYLGAG
jgi:AraC-like DNA-binding protein/mannose-6-phosphate isomerase-like protein (cupin superfamily)